jgi:hypothetical protein
VYLETPQLACDDLSKFSCVFLSNHISFRERDFVPEADALSLHMRWRAAGGPTLHMSQLSSSFRNNTLVLLVYTYNSTVDFD